MLAEDAAAAVVVEDVDDDVDDEMMKNQRQLSEEGCQSHCNRTPPHDHHLPVELGRVSCKTIVNILL